MCLSPSRASWPSVREGNYALAAARALEDSDLSAEEIAGKALKIAAEICVYTNGNTVSRPLIQSDSALETAVARGIISKSQANSIRLIANEEAGESKLPPSSQENDDEGFSLHNGLQ